MLSVKKSTLCSQFKSFNCDRRLSVLSSNILRLNTLSSGHFTKNCHSSNHQKSQRFHHTYRPQNNSSSSQQSVSSTPSNVQPSNTEPVTSASNAVTTRISSNVLLITCVLVIAPDGSSVNARALLDSGSTITFISERVAQALRFSRSQQQATIYGVAGLAHGRSVQSVGTFIISLLTHHTRKFQSLL